VRRSRRSFHPIPLTKPISPQPPAQVARTFAYFTKPGGYASLNERRVALAESTCAGRIHAAGGRLNIVDLSGLALERAASAREAVETMGAMAERYGYRDAAESLLVADPHEVYVFHILPDDTGRGAVWAAQRVPDGHVAAVMNAFTIRVVDFTDPHSYLTSMGIRDVARRAGGGRTDGGYAGWRTRLLQRWCYASTTFPTGAVPRYVAGTARGDVCY